MANTREKFILRNHRESWRAECRELEGYYQRGFKEALDDMVALADYSGRALPRWAVAALAQQARDRAAGVKPKKKMGRHATYRAEAEQFSFDVTVYKHVLMLRDQKVKWAKIYDTLSPEFGVEPEVIRKTYSRAKKKLKTDFYSSSLYDRPR